MQQKCTASLIKVASHGHSQLAIFFFPLSQFLVSVELPPFPGTGIIGDPVLFSVGVSGLRQLLHSLVSSSCTVEKKGLRRGRRAKLLECQDKWPTRPTRACGINFCCPSLLFLCCQWLFGLLKWPIFSLLRQSPLVIFQSLLSLWHAPQAVIKKICGLVNF